MKFNIKKILVPLGAVASIAGIATLVKDGVGGDWYQGEEEIYGKTVVITGATSGLGKQTAHELASRGGKLILACRDIQKCAEVRDKIIEDTFNRSVQCKKLDLTSLNSIRKFAADINANESKIDILINNAGVMMLKDKDFTQDGIELHLGVNYMGPFLLNHLLLDKLKASPAGRILNITCFSFTKGKIDFRDLNFDIYYKGQHAYDRSKMALFLHSESLAERLKDTNISVYCINPGTCKTELQRHMGWQNNIISKYVFLPIHALLTKDPVRGIQTILYCALNPDIEKDTGKLYSECEEVTKLGRRNFELIDKQRLWATSELWTRIREMPAEEKS